MRISKTAVAFLVGCGLVVAQVEGGANSRPSNDRVKTQIKNLDNDSFDLRTKAMDDLRAAGEDARADLEAARTSPSLEVRTRAETLLKELDANKAPVAGQKKAVKPVTPDEDKKPDVVSERAPRLEDFQDSRAYLEAMQKWMRDQMGRDQRFPTFVLPDGQTELPPGVQVFTPDMTMGGGGQSMSITTRDGETTAWKSGPDGVNVKITKRGEDGKTVTEEYTAKDEETFKAEHPDIWEKHHPKDGNSRVFTMGGQSPFWRQGGRGQTVIVPQPPIPGRQQGANPFTELLEQGPQLGVIPSAVPPVLDKQLKLKGEGVVIDSVLPDSLAARMGFQELDVLVQLDGQVVRDRSDIARVVRNKNAPATATARVMREGVPVELSAPREKSK